VVVDRGLWYRFREVGVEVQALRLSEREMQRVLLSDEK